jgi:hypothetical protein
VPPPRRTPGTLLADAAQEGSFTRCAMWHWITCLVTGHEYSVSCDHGRMFLKCLVCGRRSEGWVVHKDTESLIPNR